MADLYDRLTEIQEMTKVLGTDVKILKPSLGSRSIQREPTPAQYSSRRAYVRAIFALIEAVVEQHKRLLLDLQERRAVTLEPGTREVLSERVYVTKDNGAVIDKEQYISLQRKIRAVYRAAEKAFGQKIEVTYGDAGWDSFQKAVDVRDRITHPKTFDDCHIDGDDLDLVDRGHEWFRTLQNEYVRVARLHREQNHW